MSAAFDRFLVLDPDGRAVEHHDRSEGAHMPGIHASCDPSWRAQRAALILEAQSIKAGNRKRYRAEGAITRFFHWNELQLPAWAKESLNLKEPQQ